MGRTATRIEVENVDSAKFDKTIFTRKLGEQEFYERGGIFQLVWGRDYRPENARAFAELVDAKVLINGHEPCPDGHNAPSDIQLIIDCCGDRASYVILPLEGELNHAEILERVQTLA